MAEIDAGNIGDLSPFELKDRLIELAQADSHRMMLNAGRGNPNFLATAPRRAFLRLGDFALEEAERTLHHVPGGFGGLPERDGIVGRFEDFAHRHEDCAGIAFLRSAVSYVRETLDLQRDVFLHELVEAFLGCNYPNPPRMLRQCETVVSAYLAREMFGAMPRSGPFRLFATEGGTAAMTYIFQSARLNGLVEPGDKVALATPIFSPYLEIPPLPRFDMPVVDIRMSEAQGWQIPDEEIEKLADPAIKLFCVVNPSNPPSVKLSDDCLDRLGRFIESRRPDLIVVTDDVYGTFADDFVSLFARCPRNTLCVYSFSKYFGATGWRLGVIALHEDNVIDEALAKLPEETLARLDRRYASLTTTPRELRFIDRLVADSRTVALNHTAGLSLPQQLQMTLFALHGLMEDADRYKAAAKRLVRDRYRTLCDNIGVAPSDDPNAVDYYDLIDLVTLARDLYGEDFAAWIAGGDHGNDVVFRLARETGVVLLPGKGFEVVDASVRVSLANLTQAQYAAIGRATRRILDELHDVFAAGPG